MAEIGLKLRIQVLLGINLIGEGMQTDTIFAILVQEKYLHRVDLVDCCQHFTRDLHVMILEDVGVRRDCLAIDGVISDFYPAEIEE